MIRSSEVGVPGARRESGGGCSCRMRCVLACSSGAENGRSPLSIS
jgi:hypothetical protein